MPAYQIFKETALPGTLVPNGIYLIAPAGQPNFLEIYVSNSAGDATRHIPTQSDIQALIDASVASASGGALIVDDIPTRDALTPDNAQQVYVVDASGDPDVDSGGATYIYRTSIVDWIKQSEDESLDLVLTWAAITDGPNSSPAQIDAAVTATHTHDNKTQLDNIGQDGDGNLTYNGDAFVKSGATGW